MMALEGVRIIDLSTVIAAPFSTSMLADFGAEVIKIEMPGAGDSFRKMGPLNDGKSIRWAAMGRNKKCITLDLHFDEGKKIFLDLIEKADVLVENFRTGTLDKWGLDIKTLRGRNPKLIVARITGYGQTGPRRSMSGFGQTCTAYSGVTYMMGFPDRVPVSPPWSLGDFTAGLNAAFGIMVALYHRDVLGGKPQEIDVSIYESLFRQQEMILADYHVNGRIRERSPLIGGAAGPSGTFQTKDGKWVIIVTPNDKVFSYLCNAMGRDDILQQYGRMDSRFPVTDMLNQIVSDWIGSLSYRELSEICEREKFPVSLIYNIEDIVNDEHYKARDSIIEVPVEDFGTMKMPAVTPLLSETPGQVLWPGAKIGAYNDEIYRELLGLDDATLADFKARNVI